MWKATIAARDTTEYPGGGVADNCDGLDDRSGGDLTQSDRGEELPARHPVVAVHGVVLHQRDDHNPPP